MGPRRNDGRVAIKPTAIEDYALSIAAETANETIADMIDQTARR